MRCRAPARVAETDVLPPGRIASPAQRKQRLSGLQGLALAAGGEDALVRALELLEDEVRRCLGLLGVISYAELDKSYLAPVVPLARAGWDSAFPLLKEGY